MSDEEDNKYEDNEYSIYGVLEQMSSSGCVNSHDQVKQTILKHFEKYDFEDFEIDKGKAFKWCMNYYLGCRAQIKREEKWNKKVIRNYNFCKLIREIDSNSDEKLKQFKIYCDQVCEHEIIKNKCEMCRGKDVCRHSRKRVRCAACIGRSFCIHFNYYKKCNKCNNARKCSTVGCEKVLRAYSEKYCLLCQVEKYPDEFKNAKKTKETIIASEIVKKFKSENWVMNKTIDSSLSLRRPDMFLEMDDKILIIEIDEHGHRWYTDEDKRLEEITEDINGKPMIVIRFNPDAYSNKQTFGVVPSCLKYDEKGYAKICNEKEFKKRIEKLIKCVDKEIKETVKEVKIIKIFYSE